MSGGTSDSFSEQSVWTGQEQFLTNIYKLSEGLTEQEYGPGRVSDLNQDQRTSMGLARSRATGGSANMRAASASNIDTLSGRYLTEGNPYSQALHDQVGREYYGDVQSLGSRMEAAGRSGSGAQARGMESAQRQLATGHAQVAYGSYEAERSRMTEAEGRAGMFAENDYRDISALAAVGEQQRSQSQLQLDDLVARFRQQQDAQGDLLRERADLIGGPTILGYSQSRSAEGGVDFCWVAAVFFGWFSKDWWAVRNWLASGWKGEAADRFGEFYVSNGEALAEAIRLDPALREEWATVFEKFLRLGRAR